jgi:hypothetical protein
MRPGRFLALFFVVSCWFEAHGQTLYHQWSMSIDIPGIGFTRDGGRIIRSDDGGNIYIAGGFVGTIDLDPSSVERIITSEGDDDWFLVKYDANGNYLWGFSAGGKSLDTTYGMEIDEKGNIVVSGAFRGVMDVDPAAGTELLLIGPGGENGTVASAFVAKYSSEGLLVWGFNLIDDATSSVLEMATDQFDNIYVTGAYGGPVDFDPSNAIAELNGTGKFLAKYDTDGNYLWAVQASNIPSRGIHCDDESNVYVTGAFTGTYDFDPSSNVVNHTSLGGRDIFITKFDDEGIYQWSLAVGSTSDDYGYAMTTDDDENLYITGDVRALADFNPTAENALAGASTGTTHTFVARYSTDGEFSWVFSLNHNANIGANMRDAGRAIVRGEKGTFYLAGNLTSTEPTDFDPAATNTINMSGRSFFVAQYRNDGNFLSVSNFPLSSSPMPEAFPNSLFLNKDHELLLTGAYAGSFDSDPEAGYDSILSSTRGMFVVKYTTCERVNITTQPSPEEVCPGAGVNLVVGATSTVSLEYQWYKDNTPIDEMTTSVLTLIDASGSTEGQYHVEIYGGCEAMSDTVRISLKPSPKFSSVNFSDVVCEGSKATFTANAGEGRYQWFKDGEAIRDAGESTFNIEQTIQSDEGTYHLKFTDECNIELTSSNMMLAVIQLVSVVTSPQDVTIIEGDVLELNAVISGENLSYSWRKDGVELEAHTSSDLMVTSSSDADAGLYTATATNQCNSAITHPANVVIMPLVLSSEDPVDDEVRYTNPFGNVFSFIIPSSTATEFSAVNIYSTQGGRIYQATTDDSTMHTINTAKWPSGLYYFVVKRRGKVKTVKLIKE